MSGQNTTGFSPTDEQRFLRRLVDVVWNEATESTTIPSTDWADRLIARAKKLDLEDPSPDPYNDPDDPPPPRTGDAGSLYDPWGNVDSDAPRWHCRCSYTRNPSGSKMCISCNGPRVRNEVSRDEHDTTAGRYLRAIPILTPLLPTEETP